MDNDPTDLWAAIEETDRQLHPELASEAEPGEERCPVCGGPTEIGQWTGAVLCQVFGSEHYRRERTDN